jgi:hypothetical protein
MMMMTRVMMAVRYIAHIFLLFLPKNKRKRGEGDKTNNIGFIYKMVYHTA